MRLLKAFTQASVVVFLASALLVGFVWLSINNLVLFLAISALLAIAVLTSLIMDEGE